MTQSAEQFITKMENDLLSYKAFFRREKALFEEQLPAIKAVLKQYKWTVSKIDDGLGTTPIGGKKVYRVWLLVDKSDLSALRLKRMVRRLKEIAPHSILSQVSGTVLLQYFEK